MVTAVGSVLGSSLESAPHLEPNFVAKQKPAKTDRQLTRGTHMPHRTSKYVGKLPNETSREQAIRLSEMIGNIKAAARFRKMTDAEFYAELDFETEKALKAKRDK